MPLVLMCAQRISIVSTPVEKKCKTLLMFFQMRDERERQTMLLRARNVLVLVCKIKKVFKK